MLLLLERARYARWKRRAARGVMVNPDIIAAWMLAPLDRHADGDDDDAYMLARYLVAERVNELCDYLGERAYADLARTFAFVATDGDGDA